MDFKKLKAKNLSSEYKIAIEKAIRTVSMGSLRRKIADGQALEDLAKEELGQVTGLVDSLSDKTTLVAAFSVAIQGFVGFYDFVEQSAEKADLKRSVLEYQIDNRFVSFSVPGKGGLSNESNFVKDLMGLIDQTDSAIPDFKSFLGIETVSPESLGDPTLYHMLPYYKAGASEKIELLQVKSLDTVRQSMHSFAKVEVPRLLDALTKEFESGYEVTHALVSFYQGTNYLKHLNLRRMLCMMNLIILWRLQHPTDLEERRDLDSDGCIKLCEALEDFLNKVLELLSSTGSHAALGKQGKMQPSVFLVQQTKALVKALRLAYDNEQSKNLSLEGVSEHARGIAKISIDPIFELLYKHRARLFKEKKTGRKSSDRLIELLNKMNRTLTEEPSILIPFSNYVSYLGDYVELHQVLNREIKTLLDALIIYCHLTPAKRKLLREQLKQQLRNPHGNKAVFLDALEHFDEAYIQPLDRVLKEEPREKQGGDSGRKNRANAIGRYFIGCLVCFIDVHQIKMDTPDSIQAAEKERTTGVQHTGKEQVDLMNLKNQDYDGQSANKPYFYWDMSSLLLLSESQVYGQQCCQLLSAVNNMANISTLTDKVGRLIQKYPNTLQTAYVTNYLKKCINNIIDAQDKFMSAVKGRQHVLNASGIISKLRACSEAFDGAVVKLRHGMRETDFDLGDDESFKKKVRDIDTLNQHLFGEPSGLTQFFSKKQRESMFAKSKHCLQPTTLPKSGSISDATASDVTDDSPVYSLLTGDDVQRALTNTPKSRLEELQTFALDELIDVCYSSMSYWSQWGHKGHLLQELKASLAQEPRLTEEVLKKYLLDLSRVVLSYRTTWCGLFQASYGYTKSAKAFIRAVQSEKTNTALPIAKILSQHRKIKLSQLDEAEIRDKFITLGVTKQFESAVDEIEQLSVCAAA
jgi:hypothetical protein